MGSLGNIATILTLAQLAGVNLGSLGQLADLAGGAGGLGGLGVANGYNSGYAPQQLTGLVVSNSGSQMTVMTSNFTPVVVDDAPAYQMGYAPSNVAVGSTINAVGYYNGNTFEATSIQ